MSFRYKGLSDVIPTFKKNLSIFASDSLQENCKTCDGYDILFENNLIYNE